MSKLRFLTFAVLATACTTAGDRFDERGRTPLMWAALRGDTADVQRLIGGGAYVDLEVPRRDVRELIAGVMQDGLPPSDVGYTALMYAVSAGRVRVVRMLIDSGADVRHVARNGHTPLGIAIAGTRVEILRLLTAAGARPDEAQFAQAVVKSPPGVVAVLAQRGGNVNASAPAEPMAGRFVAYPLLIVATLRGEPSIVKSLLDAGATVNIRDPNGWTALRFARDPDVRARVPRAAEIATLLEGAGARDDAGTRETTLLDAVQRKDAAGVRRALRAGANPNARDQKGLTPLINAATRGSADVVAILAAGGAHLNIAPVHFGSTAMTAAIENGHAEVVRALIAAGARSDQPDSKGRTPMFAATLQSRFDIVAMLLADSAEPDPWSLGFAARRGDSVSVRLLLEHGGDSLAIRPLLQAINGCEYQDNTTVIRMLVAPGRRLDQLSDYAPMNRAARWCSAEALRLLLQHGGDPNERGFDGRTALMQAADGGRIENVRVLVSAGADIEAKGRGREKTDVFISAADHPDVLRELRRLRDSLRSASQ